jgi:hypothetical protein
MVTDPATPAAGAAGKVRARPRWGALVLIALVIAAVVGVALSSGRAAPTATGSSAPAVPSAGASPESSLHTGEWLLILESISKGAESRSSAEAKARSLREKAKGRRKVVVLDSSIVKGLTPGYWAVAVPGFTSKASATKACSDFGRKTGGTCYPRVVK